MDSILAISRSSLVGKVMLSFVHITKSPEFFEVNCNIAWERHVKRYAVHTALSLLKLKSEIHSSMLDSVEKDPVEKDSNLKGL